MGEPLPDVLRELYRAFDGFLGPTDAVFFWPLFAGTWGEWGLVDLNRFLLREGDEFPTDFVARCLFFGDDGGGTFWGIKKDLPGKVIRWDPEWGVEFQVVGENPLEVWVAEKEAYEECDAGARVNRRGIGPTPESAVNGDPKATRRGAITINAANVAPEDV